MDKLLLEIVLAFEGSRAVYKYSMGGETIPVVCVQKTTKKLLQDLQGCEQKGWVIITENDLEHGNDVYSVILLHMQKNTILERGEDILSIVSIAKKELRPHLECAIRTVLIDLREAIILGKKDSDLLPWLRIQCDRIWNACGHMIDNSKRGRFLLTDIDTLRNLNQERIYEELSGSKNLDAWSIHEELHRLVEHIDEMKV